MKIRQANKIMRNVRLYPIMHRIYGNGRVSKACRTCLRYRANKSEVLRNFIKLCDNDPLSTLRIIKNKLV